MRVNKNLERVLAIAIFLACGLLCTYLIITSIPMDSFGKFFAIVGICAILWIVVLIDIIGTYKLRNVV